MVFQLEAETEDDCHEIDGCSIEISFLEHFLQMPTFFSSSSYSEYLLSIETAHTLQTTIPQSIQLYLVKKT